MKWTEQNINDLKQIRIDVLNNIDFHINEGNSNLYVYNILMYICIIIGPLSGFVSSIQTIIYPEEDIIFPIMSSSMGFLSGIIIALTKFGKYNTKANSHQSIALRYIKLEKNISKQLTSSEHDMLSYEYMKWLFDIMETLLDTKSLKKYNIQSHKIDKKDTFKGNKFNIEEEHIIKIRKKEQMMM